MPIDPNKRFTNIDRSVFTPIINSIWSITNTFPAVITTTQNGTMPQPHGYETGLIVRLRIPEYFGMTQANNFYGAITKIDDVSFLMNLDATNLDPFVIPSILPGRIYSVAQVVPVGEVNDSLSQAMRNQLPPLSGFQ